MKYHFVIVIQRSSCEPVAAYADINERAVRDRAAYYREQYPEPIYRVFRLEQTNV